MNTVKINGTETKGVTFEQLKAGHPATVLSAPNSISNPVGKVVIKVLTGLAPSAVLFYPESGGFDRADTVRYWTFQPLPKGTEVTLTVQ